MPVEESALGNQAPAEPENTVWQGPQHNGVRGYHGTEGWLSCAQDPLRDGALVTVVSVGNVEVEFWYLQC